MLGSSSDVAEPISKASARRYGGGGVTAAFTESVTEGATLE
jgi:hypothetical protein